MAKRLIIAAVLALTLILPGLALTPTTVTTSVEPVAAHSTDCPVYVSPLTYYSSARLLDGFSRINCHSSSYYLTAYVCGGVNGQGYCRSVQTARCGITSCSSLTASWSCSLSGSGPYWHYGGAKLQHRTSTGQLTSGVWTYGPGVWTSGSC